MISQKTVAVTKMKSRKMIEIGEPLDEGETLIKSDIEDLVGGLQRFGIDVVSEGAMCSSEKKRA